MNPPSNPETKPETPFPPFEVLDGDRTKGLILVCDHARNTLPAEYGDLGLPAQAFERHIAFDIGAESVTRGLSALLDAPAVLATFSRLLIDPNRGEDDPTLIRQLYDGTVIPGNYPLRADERDSRIARFYRPYRNAVADTVQAVAAASGASPFLLSIHSFTPRLGRQAAPRPWHVGVLWDTDHRAAWPLIERLAADKGLIVGDNEPYDGALRGDTIFRHAILAGYAHALVEVRQDLIADERGADEWAARLAPIVDAVNRRPDMHRVEHFGSRTGPI